MDYYDGDENRKNIIANENKGNEIIASAGKVPTLTIKRSFHALV